MSDPEALSGQRALVTGASGFIGSALCRQLTSAGMEVHGVSRQEQPPADFCTRWWVCHLEDRKSVGVLMENVKPSYIFHLASRVTGSRDLELVIPTLESNFSSTANLLVAATKQGCKKIVLTGSLEEPDPQSAHAVPSSPYSASKFAANTYGRMFHALYDTPVVILRVFMVYGPGQQDLKKLVPYVILSLLRGETPVLSSGIREVDWVYVQDVVDGFVAAAKSNNILGETIDLGSGRLTSVRSVVEKLYELIRPGEVPIFGSLRDRVLEQVKSANIEKSREIIGWSATTSLQEGMSKTIDWYRNTL